MLGKSIHLQVIPQQTEINQFIYNFLLIYYNRTSQNGLTDDDRCSSPKPAESKYIKKHVEDTPSSHTKVQTVTPEAENRKVRAGITK